MSNRLILIVLLTLYGQVAWGESIEVSEKFQTLLPHAILVKDADGSMAISDVLRLASSTGIPVKDTNISFAFSHDTHWFVIPLTNSVPQSLNRLLVFEPTWLDDIQVTLVSEHLDQFQTVSAGDTLPFSQRELAHQYINLELAIPPGESFLVVRTQTRDPYLVKMTLWERTAFIADDGNNKLYLGLIYGVIVAMMLYNLLLYISIREKVYAAYVGYLFFFVIMHATYSGLMYAYVWPNSPEWSNWAHSIFDHLFVFAGFWFCINFLDLPQRLPAVYRWVKRLVRLIAVSFVLTAVVGGYDLHVDASIFWIILYAPLVIFLGLISLKSGNRSARFFLTAAVAGFVGSFITAMAVSGVIPFTFWTFRAVDFGMLMDAVLLSLALADRLRLARAESENARAELLDTARRYAQTLELEVAQRTAELQQANITKDKFLSIVGHDLKSPIGGLNVLFNSLLTRPEDLTEETLSTVRTTVRSTSEFLDQLFIWARSQRGQIDCQPEIFDVREIMADITALYAQQAGNKGVTLKLDLTSSCRVYADKAMIHTVLRNLVSNALKYSSSGDEVRANFKEEGSYCRFEIIDTGTGISSKVLPSLFRLDQKPTSTPGTSNETGTGLGLILCAEFVSKNMGQIGAESEQGLGSCFWFTLPKAG